MTIVYNDKIRNDLTTLWQKAIVRAESLAEAKRIAQQLSSNKARYEVVSNKTGVPWFVIASIHHMESDCDWKTHLHNGDSLNARTHQVPAGRPVAGNPPFTWEESAIDALGYDHFVNEKDWCIEHILFMLEKYNGFGYRNHGYLSCYVWAGTTVQTKGRYVSDGKFDTEGWSNRVGCAAIIETLINTGEVSFDNKPAEPAPTPGADKIVTILVNVNDSSDYRGLDVAGKTVHWFDPPGSLAELYLSALKIGADKAKLVARSLDKRLVVCVQDIK
jgi:lysozyme family protein